MMECTKECGTLPVLHRGHSSATYTTARLTEGYFSILLTEFKVISKFEKIVIARLTFIDHNNWVLLTQIPAGAPTHPISQRFEEMPEPVAPYYGPYISGVVIGPPAPPPVSLSPGVSIVFSNL